MRGIPCSLLFIFIVWPTGAGAAPILAPGDFILRADIQLLADSGIIKGPVSTWPLAWGPIVADIQAANLSAGMPANVYQALQRVRQRTNWEVRSGETLFYANASLAEDPTRIRGFSNTPRDSGEIGAGLSYTGDWFAASLRGQVIDSPLDGEETRADGSFLGLIVGNYSINLNTMDRWWGPGWDGSLILSNNARAIPSISIERNFTDSFETPWLSWLGPWDLAVHYGQFESDRVIPNARFLGVRFNFRPRHSLEIGLSRTAQWCGNGRPCGLDTVTDLLLGIDNIGDQGVNLSSEPGNQLAGIDFRWSYSLLGQSMALYGQLIGEDEAGGLPSRFLGQFGIEGHGLYRTSWTFQWFGEFAGTSCQFHESSALPNCAYNHSIYGTGYRYRGRSVGHSADNDARLVSAGISIVNQDETQWQLILRVGELNRIGAPDPRNRVTPIPEDIASVDLSHSRAFSFGSVQIGLGFERTERGSGGTASNDTRAYVQWRSSY